MSDIKDKLIPVNLEQEMKKSFISYAMAVIVDRDDGMHVTSGLAGLVTPVGRA